MSAKITKDVKLTDPDLVRVCGFLAGDISHLIGRASVFIKPFDGDEMLRRVKEAIEACARVQKKLDQ